MAKYLLLKHYRGAPASVNDVPMDQWTPDEVEAHIQYMNDFAARLERSGEFVGEVEWVLGRIAEILKKTNSDAHTVRLRDGKQ